MTQLEDKDKPLIDNEPAKGSESLPQVDEDGDDEDSGMNRKVIIVAGVIFVIIAVAMIFAIQSLIGEDSSAPKKMVQQITVLAPPPPPPPPPEVEEPPPEVEEEVDVPDEPEEAPDAPDEIADEPPMGEDLGLDADGVAGADGFGLMGKKGGRGLLAGGGADKQRFDFYASSVQQDLFEHLSEHKDIRRNRYSVIVHLWISSVGKVNKIKLIKPSGIAELDTTLRSVLAQIDKVNSAPPEGMPQPIRLRITSRI